MSGKARSSSWLKPPRSERLPWALWLCPRSILVLSVMSFVFLCESVLHQHGSGMFRIVSTPSSRSELTHPWVDQNQWSPPSQEKYVQDWYITQSVPKMKGFEQNSLGCSLKQGAALLYFWQSQRKMAMDKGTNRKALGSQVLFHLDSRSWFTNQERQIREKPSPWEQGCALLPVHHDSQRVLGSPVTQGLSLTDLDLPYWLDGSATWIMTSSVPAREPNPATDRGSC